MIAEQDDLCVSDPTLAQYWWFCVNWQMYLFRFQNIFVKVIFLEGMAPGWHSYMAAVLMVRGCGAKTWLSFMSSMLPYFDKNNLKMPRKMYLNFGPKGPADSVYIKCSAILWKEYLKNAYPLSPTFICFHPILSFFIQGVCLGLFQITREWFWTLKPISGRDGIGWDWDWDWTSEC